MATYLFSGGFREGTKRAIASSLHDTLEDTIERLKHNITHQFLNYRIAGFVTRTLMSRLKESATLKSVTFYLVTFYHVRFCNCLVLCLYFSISLRSKWGLFEGPATPKNPVRDFKSSILSKISRFL